VTVVGAVVAGRVAAAVFDDLIYWAAVIGAIALGVLLLPVAMAVLGFAGLLALFGGLSGTVSGGGPVAGGPPTAAAVTQVPPEQLALMRQVAASASCSLPWTVLAAISNVESGFGKTADQFSSAGAYGYGQFLEASWRSYGGDIPWRATDPKEQAKAVGDRQDSTNYRYALPAMARYLCASGAGQDLRKAIFAYNRADWYVAEIVQLAARYGGIGAAGGALIDGWADRPTLNQYDRRNYRTDSSWVTWRDYSCSAAALDWMLGAYGQPLGSIDEAIGLIGPNTGIAPGPGLLDARGPALARALSSRGLQPRTPGTNPLSSIAQLKEWLEQGPLLLDGVAWFGKGHWFVAVGYDKNGVYIRDSSGWDNRYLTWAKLYGEVGFTGWVVGVAP
jgi:hypothetical protein